MRFLDQKQDFTYLSNKVGRCISEKNDQNMNVENLTTGNKQNLVFDLQIVFYVRFTSNKNQIVHLDELYPMVPVRAPKIDSLTFYKQP